MLHLLAGRVCVTHMGNLIHWPPTWSTLLLLPALFIGFTVHELAHALVAYLLGDTSQVERKRLSFNPMRHVSWVGLVIFLLFRFGWAKPVWVDPNRFRIKNRPFGMFLVSVAGASANLLAGLAAFAGVLATMTTVWTLTGTPPMEVWDFLALTEPGPNAQGVAISLSSYMMMVNLALAVFNLLPLPPLDGFQAAISLVAAIRLVLRQKAGTEPVRQPAPSTAAGEAATRSPARIHFDIGLAYQKAGQLDEAIARYRQATALEERFAQAYYNLGLTYWAKGRISLATSAFRAAMRSGGDLGVRVQAELRLRELARARQDSEGVPGPVPPPLEPGVAGETEVGEAPGLDPAAVRRLWLRLGVGAVGMLALAASAWLYVTAVALSLVGGAALP